MPDKMIPDNLELGDCEFIVEPDCINGDTKFYLIPDKSKPYKYELPYWIGDLVTIEAIKAKSELSKRVMQQLHVI